MEVSLKTTLLSREQILGVQDLSFEDVDVPEWGGVVRVKMLTGTERDQFEQELVVRHGKKTSVNLANIRARLVALCMVDADGALLFTEKDVAALGRKSAMALNRVFEVAQRLNGLTEQDIEELEGNSETGQSDDSISG
jgi:hypothetical protein